MAASCIQRGDRGLRDLGQSPRSDSGEFSLGGPGQSPWLSDAGARTAPDPLLAQLSLTTRAISSLATVRPPPSAWGPETWGYTQEPWGVQNSSLIPQAHSHPAAAASPSGNLVTWDLLWHPRNPMGIWPESRGPAHEPGPGRKLWAVAVAGPLGQSSTRVGSVALGSKLTRLSHLSLTGAAGWEGQEQPPRGVLQACPSPHSTAHPTQCWLGEQSCSSTWPGTPTRAWPSPRLQNVASPALR